METNNHLDELLQEIQVAASEDLVFEKEKIATAIQNDASLYSGLAVKILSIFGGIISSFFFTGFLLLAGIWNSGITMGLFGAVFIGGAIGLGRMDKNVFLDTVNIAMWALGIALFTGGFMVENFNGNFSLPCFLVLIIGTITFFLVERFMLRFLSVLLICCCMVGLILINEVHSLIHLIVAGTALKMTYLYLNEAQLISQNKFSNKVYASLQIGFVFCLIGLLILIGKGGRNFDFYFENLWISSIVIIGAILFSIYKIMEGLNIEDKSIKTTVLVLSALILLPTVFAPFISGAILILILNYHVGHRTGIAIGIIALLYSVMQYYYDLNLTLLQKSGILMVSGILFLIAYFIFRKKINSQSHEEL